MTEKLYIKYGITKTNGNPVDPKAQYFVLRIDTDPAARAALTVYADEMWDSGKKEFAEQLWTWVNKFSDEDE